MKDELISFETAKLAKEKGFKPEREWNPEYVSGYYYDDHGDKEPELTEIQEEDYSEDCKFLAPTQSLLQRWLREMHNLNVFVIKSVWKEEQDSYFFTIHSKNCASPPFSTYEKALESGLILALKFIENV